MTQRLHWGFPDSSEFQGTWEERLEQTRQVRNQIKEQISHEFCAILCPLT